MKLTKLFDKVRFHLHKIDDTKWKNLDKEEKLFIANLYSKSPNEMWKTSNLDFKVFEHFSWKDFL